MSAEVHGDLFTRSFTIFIERVGACIEAAGVAVIAIGAIATTAIFLFALRRQSAREAYAAYRMGLARSILLGLELLVAGDIIRTVVVSPSLMNVTLLGLIVLIRTFLSFTLEMEVTGRWPWRRGDKDGEPDSRRTV